MNGFNWQELGTNKELKKQKKNGFFAHQIPLRSAKKFTKTNFKITTKKILKKATASIEESNWIEGGWGKLNFSHDFVYFLHLNRQEKLRSVINQMAGHLKRHLSMAKRVEIKEILMEGLTD